MSENKNIGETHGCIVCAKVFNVLAIYSPSGKLVDFTVTSPGGHGLPGEQKPLVACDSHSGDAIQAAYKKWQSRGVEAQDA